MYRLTILYGDPTDRAAFREYYESTHIPLARRMQGLSDWTLQWLDPEQSHGWFLVAELTTPDKAAMDAILASPEGQAASADLENFVTGGVQFLGGEVHPVALG